VYDRGAQFVFIGQGLNNREYIDKPFYILMLTLFHFIAGNDYLPVVQVQAVFLAVFPALLYLMGKALHSRTAGFLAGLFLVCQQTNSIAATLQIQVSHSRLMMAEFPTALGMALLALVLIRWLKRPSASGLGVFLAGGVLGILILIRTNPIFLLPFIFLIFVLVFNCLWRKWLLASLLFFAGVMLVIGPWFFLNRTPEGRIYFEEKFQAVFDLRYDESKPIALAVDITSTPPPATTPTLPAVSATPTVSASPIAQTPTALPTPTPAAEDDPIAKLARRTYKALQFVPGHFIHNLVTAVLILPTSFDYDSFSFLDLDLKAPYWKITWDGILPPGSAVILLTMLGILALGVGSAWHSARLAGLVPLVFLVAYYLSNAFARTSGARYLVPADWVVLF
ncbi:hypothetical protein EG834_15770, partial [bacterium]|nr:hypothetical protein [bacterium]